jgi:hypothetical protein
MSESLPKSLQDDIDRNERIIEDNGKYYLYNPFKGGEKKPICGFLLENNTRCREKSGQCQHPVTSVEVLTPVVITDIFSVLQDAIKDGEGGEEFSMAMQMVRDLKEEDVSRVDSDIKIHYGLLHTYMQQCLKTTFKETKVDGELVTLEIPGKITKADIGNVLTILKAIVHAKEIKAKIQKTTTLDNSAVAEFVQEVLSCVRSNVDTDTYSKIMQDVRDKVIEPRRIAEVIERKPIQVYDAEMRAS